MVGQQKNPKLKPCHLCQARLITLEKRWCKIAAFLPNSQCGICEVCDASPVLIASLLLAANAVAQTQKASGVTDFISIDTPVFVLEHVESSMERVRRRQARVE